MNTTDMLDEKDLEFFLNNGCISMAFLSICMGVCGLGTGIRLITQLPFPVESALASFRKLCHCVFTLVIRLKCSKVRAICFFMLCNTYETHMHEMFATLLFYHASW